MNSVDESKLCRVYYVASTMFYPLVLATIFWGIGYGVGLLLFSLVTGFIKTDFDRIINFVKVKPIIITIQFIVFNCIFGIWYLINYLYNRDANETTMMFNISWSLIFAIASILLAGINWKVYLLFMLFIGVLQSIIRPN